MTTLTFTINEGPKQTQITAELSTTKTAGDSEVRIAEEISATVQEFVAVRTGGELKQP